MYKIIFFDLDDTLVDFSDSEIKSLNNIHKKYYRTINLKEFQAVFKSINSELWKKVGAKDNPLTPSKVRILRFEQLNKKLNCKIAPINIADDYEKYLGENSEWIPGAENAINFLKQKGHILGIVTNGLTSVQYKKYNKHQLHKWFECFTVSDKVGFSKPQKEIFDISLKEIAIKRNQSIETIKGSMLMVGDSIISDGHSAKNLGIDFCLIDKKLEIAKIDIPVKFTIKSVAELPYCLGYKNDYNNFIKENNNKYAANFLSIFDNKPIAEVDQTNDNKSNNNIKAML